MKKQFLFIPLILAVAIAGGIRIIHSKPSAPKAEEAHDEHAHHEEAGEHGREGHVELTAEARKNANLEIEKAGGAKIKSLLSVYGKIASNEETLAHVQPRFPGVVKEVRKRLGDKVEKGEVLAVVESNESLRPYEIKSEIAGTVIQKDITHGEFVKNEDTIYTIADLTTVWVDLAVFRQDFGKLKVGQHVAIHPGAGVEAIRDKIAYISPFGTEGSQTMLARCVVPNPDGDLRPGLFVTAEIATNEVDVPVAVKLGAIQTIDAKPVVFVEEGENFEMREVKLGAKDSTHVEILEGLQAGDKYVSGNSFILKAELGKEEAEHEH
jgi:cobalt-zinc-cadmium efflux system membrane fusion protein